MQNIVITLLIGITGWKIAQYLKIPAPGMIGSMLAVGFTNIFFSYASYSTPIKICGVALSGAYVGLQINRDDIKNIKIMIKPFILLITMLTINTFIVGSIIHFLCDIDWLTALLSCVAGGATDMSIVAMDLGADGGTVAMMQTLRLIGTLLLFPYWITFQTKNESNCLNSESLSKNKKIKPSFLDKYIKTNTQKILFTFIITVICGYIGLFSKIPAASMMFPMFVIMILNITTNTCIVTKKEKVVAQILAGSVVGCSITSATFSSPKTTLIPLCILLMSYFIINYIFSKICKSNKWLDLKSAMFASAPGGATDMTLIAADLGADLTKIALIQAFRAAYVVSIMPLLIVLFVHSL